jgi:hypothetical protein
MVIGYYSFGLQVRWATTWAFRRSILHTSERIIHERLTQVVGEASGGGKAFQERREPIHGGFAKTSMFLTILKSPPLLARRLDTS